MESIRERIAKLFPRILFMDGYDDCIVGIVRRCRMGAVVLYDQDMVISGLMKDGMSDVEAVEYFEFNQIGGWHGEGTPCFMSFAPLKGKCIVGRVRRYGMDDVTLYDQLAVISKLVGQGMTKLKAEKLFKKKYLDVWKGKRTPCFMDFILPGRDGCLSVAMEGKTHHENKSKNNVAKKK